MYGRFTKEYAEVATHSVENLPYRGSLALEKDLRELLSRFGGKSFNNGIYRICTFDQVERLTRLGESYFSKLSGKIQAFGFDWLGRVFALDQTGGKKKSDILLLEPGAGDALEIPSDIVGFHDKVLVNHSAEALALDFFKEWVGQTSVVLKHSDCAGYKVPLFLGGADETHNLETIDLEVYLSISAQLWNKTRELKPGQKIGDISIS